MANQPIKTLREASRAIRMHNTVIKKYIDSNEVYKGLLIFSSPQD